MAIQKIIHLSDLHISTKNKPKVSRFRKVASVIGRYYAGVPVLIAGDITDSATQPQMDLARKAIEKLADIGAAIGLISARPSAMMPGNGSSRGQKMA